VVRAADTTDRLLVVEDDGDMGRLLVRGLAAEGYEVELASDGVAALVLATREAFAVAILDVMLPGMTGFELCRRLREAHPLMPIILLTARDSVDDRVRGLDAGADDYLIKPFSLSELNARVRAIRRREKLLPPQRVLVGRVDIEHHDHQVTVSGAPVPLSPKEFALLRLLAQRANTTVTRDEIMQEVWGTTAHMDANVVDQYVSYLRRKLEPMDSGVTLVTQRGVGFRLEVDRP